VHGEIADDRPKLRESSRHALPSIMDISGTKSVQEVERTSLERPSKGLRDDASSIRSAALGDDLPSGYFYSVKFLGAATVSDSTANALRKD